VGRSPVVKPDPPIWLVFILALSALGDQFSARLFKTEINLIDLFCP
jgi:hypothetical protein